MKEAFEKNITLCYCLISVAKVVHHVEFRKKHPGKASSKSVTGLPIRTQTLEPNHWGSNLNSAVYLL